LKIENEWHHDHQGFDPSYQILTIMKICVPFSHFQLSIFNFQLPNKSAILSFISLFLAIFAHLQKIEKCWML